MHILVNNSTRLVLPIFYIVDYSHDIDNPYAVLRAIEIIFTIISALMTISSCFLVITTRAYHFNISLIYFVFSLHWFELMLSRILVLPYQEGLKTLRAYIPLDQPYFSAFDNNLFYADDPPIDYFLCFGGYLRARYILTVCFALPSVAIERICSIYYIQDYERNYRAHIAYILIITSEILATIFAILLVTEIVSIVALDGLFSFLTVVSYLTFLQVGNVSKKLIKRCKISATFYTLSIKYQLSENIRTSKLIHLVIFEVSTIIVMAAAIIASGHFGVLINSHQAYLFILFELILHVNPILISGAMFWVTPSWVRKMIRFAPRCFKSKSGLVDYCMSNEQRNVETVVKMGSSMQTATYFEQLQKVW